MNKEKKLVFARTVFVFIVFVFLGVIVVTEKAGGIFIPKIKEKMISYMEEKYSLSKDALDFQEPSYQSTKYTMKVTSKENKNYYFYIYYKNKKITDTYQTDYEEGKSLLKELEKKLEKKIQEKTNLACQVTIDSPLNHYTSSVQNRIIKEENLLELRFYTIKKELLIKNWEEETIAKEITQLLGTYQKNQITPKIFIITITNKKEITQSIEIHLTDSFLENDNPQAIIHDIINDKETDLLKENHITYKILN